MRNKIIKFASFIILCLCMQVAVAAKFIATVDDNQINFGQSIHLELQLEDAKDTAGIDLSNLSKDFIIYSQQQFSSYSNVNGAVTAKRGWHVNLMPKRVGEFVIPPISIETDKGVLKSLPIKISVLQAKQGDKGGNDTVGISLVSAVNKAKAYVNEPVMYTLKIISYKPIANIVLDDIKSDSAIIEKIGEPKQYDQSLGGVRAHIIEIRYAITALKPGKVAIAPAVMHGELQVPVQAQKQQRFGIFNNLFIDPAFELKPFSLQSEAITIDVTPPAVTGKNWLPLQNLTITQTWDNTQNIKVGDTITRKIKIVAKGAFAKQLPTVNEFMQQDNLKIYANKPTFVESFDANTDTIIGTREEEYSIVPQAAGTITFPEIKIKWWNLRTNKPEVTVLPAKTLQVDPAVENATPAVTVDYSADEPQQVIAQPTTTKTKSNTVLYIVIGALAGVILTLMALLVYIIARKRPVVINTSSRIKTPKDEEITINTPDDLRKVILRHAIKQWSVPEDITLNRLGDALTNNNYTYDIGLYTNLSQYLNAAIYAKVVLELSMLLGQWEAFKQSVVKNKHKIQQEVNNEDYSSLNPT